MDAKYVDKITKGGNENWLNERFDDLHKKSDSNYAFVSLNIKRFKHLDQTYGREKSNYFLLKIYQAVLSCLKTDEYVARIYANYFNVLLQYNEEDDLVQRIYQIDLAIYNIEEIEIYHKIYAGYGIYPITDKTTGFYIAQDNAEQSRVKSKEKDYLNSHFEIYGISYQPAVNKYVNLESRIENAIENNEFKVYLQPKIDVQTGKIIGAEALVRWLEPEYGFIPVADFLPILERNGLIAKLDLRNFDYLCRRMQKWMDNGHLLVSVSFNLSRVYFEDDRFLPDYIRTFEKYHIPKEMVEIELMESIIMNQNERLVEVVKSIRDYGFKCSLDDFGSGYSTFNVLSNLNLNTIKIDRSFFKGHSDKEHDLVRGIVSIARDLKMKTVAEGIEDMEYVEFLREVGCDFIQGFIFSQAIPIKQFEELLLRNHNEPFIVSKQMNLNFSLTNN